MTDIAEDTVASLSAAVPAIARDKAEALGRYIGETVAGIIAEFRQKSS
jgi:hypothetical protein